MGKARSRSPEPGWKKSADGSWTAPGRRTGGDGVGAVEAGQPERAASQALDRYSQEQPGSAAGVEYRVTLVAVVGRELDGDNLVSACKPLRDAVAATLGIDDGDKRITFEYGQTRTDGDEGVMVKITKRQAGHG